MIDLHCHILPGIDDGAVDLATSLAMAEAFVAGGVEMAACTPHILPGLYHNSGPAIRAAVAALQSKLDEAGIPLRLTTGADVHIAPNLVAGLRSGTVLSLADSRYVLIEPPHHVLPARFEESLFELVVAGYVPIITHPERLSWLPTHYGLMQRLATNGIWMQITAGSLTGKFGKSALSYAERLLSEGLVHILASDAHDVARRAPDLAQGAECAARIVGRDEATNLVWGRPRGVLANLAPNEIAPLPSIGSAQRGRQVSDRASSVVAGASNGVDAYSGMFGGVRDIGRRLRRLFE